MLAVCLSSCSGTTPMAHHRAEISQAFEHRSLTPSEQDKVDDPLISQDTKSNRDDLIIENFRQFRFIFCMDGLIFSESEDDSTSYPLNWEDWWRGVQDHWGGGARSGRCAKSETNTGKYQSLLRSVQTCNHRRNQRSCLFNMRKLNVSRKHKPATSLFHTSTRLQSTNLLAIVWDYSWPQHKYFRIHWHGKEKQAWALLSVGYLAPILHCQSNYNLLFGCLICFPAMLCLNTTFTW